MPGFLCARNIYGLDAPPESHVSLHPHNFRCARPAPKRAVETSPGGLIRTNHLKFLQRLKPEGALLGAN